MTAVEPLRPKIKCYWAKVENGHLVTDSFRIKLSYPYQDIPWGYIQVKEKENGEVLIIDTFLLS